MPKTVSGLIIDPQSSTIKPVTVDPENDYDLIHDIVGHFEVYYLRTQIDEIVAEIYVGSNGRLQSTDIFSFTKVMLRGGKKPDWFGTALLLGFANDAYRDIAEQDASAWGLTFARTPVDGNSRVVSFRKALGR